MKLFKILMVMGVLAFGTTASAATFSILGGAFDSTPVGDVDSLIAVDVMQGNSNPDTEETWVNDTLNNLNPPGPVVQYTVSIDPVVYYDTDKTGVYAFELSVPYPDYFLVKNSTDIALFQNNVELDWGVFNIAEMEGFHLGEEYTISHVTQFDSIGEVPIPAAVWLFGSGLLGLVGVARRKVTDNNA